MRPRSRLRWHPFRPTKWRNHEGKRICECGSLETDSVHRAPETDPGWVAEEARRMGERDGD